VEGGGHGIFVESERRRVSGAVLSMDVVAKIVRNG